MGTSISDGGIGTSSDSDSDFAFARPLILLREEVIRLYETESVVELLAESLRRPRAVDEPCRVSVPSNRLPYKRSAYAT